MDASRHLDQTKLQQLLRRRAYGVVAWRPGKQPQAVEERRLEHDVAVFVHGTAASRTMAKGVIQVVTGIAPGWWTPRALSRQVFLPCREPVLRTRRSSAARWSSW